MCHRKDFTDLAVWYVHITEKLVWFVLFVCSICGGGGVGFGVGGFLGHFAVLCCVGRMGWYIYEVGVPYYRLLRCWMEGAPGFGEVCWADCLGRSVL